jgi:hypothetical protein
MTSVLFWYLGVRLSAPTWYFALLGIRIFFGVIKFGVDMYKAGAKS